MNTNRIKGVELKCMRIIPDERGRVMEILRCDETSFKKFGQVYLTTAYPGVVKAWHLHKKQTDFLCVIRGMMKVVLCDDREDSPTLGEVNEFFIGDHNSLAISIPPFVYHGFKCISDTEAMVINVPSEPYNYKEPDEYRLPAHTKEISYDWARQDG